MMFGRALMTQSPPPDNENFADAPISLAEARAERQSSATAWGPRDVLVNILRAIDRGEIAPDRLAVVWADSNADGTRVCYRVATQSLLETVGLLTEAARMAGTG